MSITIDYVRIPIRLTCPTCGRKFSPSGMGKHLSGAHQWRAAQIDAWRDENWAARLDGDLRVKRFIEALAQDLGEG